MLGTCLWKAGNLTSKEQVQLDFCLIFALAGCQSADDIPAVSQLSSGLVILTNAWLWRADPADKPGGTVPEEEVEGKVAAAEGRVAEIRCD
jgi:hypothetical protein